MAGAMLVRLAEGGRARPYELGELRYALRQVLSRHAIALLEWLLAAELGFGGKRGTIIKHPEAAALIGAAPRTAGDAMRELVRLGLVRQRPHFRLRTVAEKTPRSRQEVLNGSGKHYELTPAYETTARCREVVGRKGARFARKYQVGKKRQPSESHPVLPDRRVGVPARRPEREFVADVLRSRRPPPRAQQVATVIERRPDGSVALGSELSAATVAQKLRTNGATTLRGADADALSEAWRAFEEHEARQKAPTN